MRRFPSPSRLQSHIFPGSSPWWGRPGPPHSATGPPRTRPFLGKLLGHFPHHSLLLQVARECPNRGRPLSGSSLTPRNWAGRPRPTASHVSSLPTGTGNTQVDRPAGSTLGTWSQAPRGLLRDGAGQGAVLAGHGENPPRQPTPAALPALPTPPYAPPCVRDGDIIPDHSCWESQHSLPSL